MIESAARTGHGEQWPPTPSSSQKRGGRDELRRVISAAKESTRRRPRAHSYAPNRRLGSLRRSAVGIFDIRPYATQG